MELLQVTKKDLLRFVDTLVNGPLDVVGVVQKDGKFTYDKLSSASDLRLDFDETLYSPKRYLLPPKDPVLSFAPKNASSCEPAYADKNQAIIGIHPCDLAAIALLDKAFAQGVIDEHYCARREQITLVGIYPTRPGKHRFVSSMIKPDEPYLAADAMLIDMGNDSYAIEIVTDRGKEFFSSSAAIPAHSGLCLEAEVRKNAVKDSVVLSMERDNLPSFLNGKERHPVWETRGRKCFSCGSCIAVCPTCYCFDMLDEMDLSFEYGLRFRCWDGCVLHHFAECAGERNFRAKPSERIRHRLYRKQKYLFEQLALPGCVGCGRCKTACIPDIAFPPDIHNDLIQKDSSHV